MRPKIRVILVRPTFSGNVGAAARAVANMDASDLILIDPQCEIDESARQYAAGAQEWLRQARIYNSWNDFLISWSDVE